MIITGRQLFVFSSMMIVGTSIEQCRGDFNNTGPTNLCKNNLDNCMKNMSAVLDHTGLSGIPKSKNEVDILCRGFKIGMKCLDDFYSLCLSEDQKNKMSDNVIGAKYTFTFLCDDEEFQKDYLKYTDCYRVIDTDWGRCTDKFMKLVHEEMNSNRSEDAKLLNLCCAKHGFVNCAYTISKIKCGKAEAMFIKKIAETLSENKSVSSVCRQIKLGYCNKAQPTTYSMITIILNVSIIIWSYKNII